MTKVACLQKTPDSPEVGFSARLKGCKRPRDYVSMEASSPLWITSSGLRRLQWRTSLGFHPAQCSKRQPIGIERMRTLLSGGYSL